MKCYQFMHVMKVLHFKNNKNPSDRANPHYKTLWIIRRFFYLNNIYSTPQHPTGNLARDEVIVKFKWRVVFWLYIPKKPRRFGIKIYNLCDGNGYMYDMAGYLGKKLMKAALNITPTHGRDMQLTREVRDTNCPRIFIFHHLNCFLTYTILLYSRSTVCHNSRARQETLSKNIWN